MDFLIINSPVSLDIALSLRKVSTHLKKLSYQAYALTTSTLFQLFRLFRALRKRIEQLHIMWKVYQKS